MTTQTAMPAGCKMDEGRRRAVAGQVTVGTSGPDVIMGTSGPDVIRAKGGADKVCSQGGADNVNGGSGADMIDLGKGADKASGAKGNDTIYGRSGNDHLKGKGGKDRLLGGRGADVLNGGSKADVLRGGSGNDSLRGKRGKDSCNGGKGTDTYTSCNEPKVSISVEAMLLTAADLGGEWLETGGRREIKPGPLLLACGKDIEADPGVHSLGLADILLDPAPPTVTLRHSGRVQTIETATAFIDRTNKAAAACTSRWVQRTTVSRVAYKMLKPPKLDPVGDGFSVFRASVTGVVDGRTLLPSETVVIQIRCGPAISRLLINTPTRASTALLKSLAETAHTRLQSVVVRHGIQCAD